MKKLLNNLLLVAAISVAAVSCKKTEDVKLGPGPKFDLDLFEANIVKALKGKTIGYSYSISQGGTQVRFGEDGDAVASWDNRGTGIKHNHNKRQDLASCSKTITALTLLSILQEKGMTEKELMYKHLPGVWNITVSPTYRQENMENLLRHETGFLNAGISYAGLKGHAEGGGIFITGTWSYQNTNYAYQRIIIAYLTHKSELQAIEAGAAADPAGTDKKLDSAIASFYITEVNKRVFAKCGIPYSRPTPNGETDPTMNYNFNTQDVGWNKGDMTLFAGSAGWRLSSTEQNNILATLKYTEKILNNTWKKKMNDRLLGWDLGRSGIVTGGMAYVHGGFFEDKNSPNAATTPAQRGCFTVHIIFPNNIECAVQCNSLGGTNNMESTVLPAYENAWK